MVILEWSGEIGYEITPSMVNSDLKNANGDDITVKLSSPGGNIIEGGDIFISLLNYRKNFPKSKMILEIGSVAASYASFLSASPVWDTVKVSDISMAMYHNPANFAFGDFMAMEENAKFLKDARDMYVSIYSNRSKKKDSEMIEMMNKTTWLMGGQAIIDAGFADELISTNDDSDVNMLATQAKQAYMSVYDKMAKNPNSNIDFNAISMNLNTIKQSTMVNPVQPTDNTNIPSSEGNSTMEVPVMNEEELKQKYPDLYESVMKAGANKERDTNSARVKALTEMKAKEEYKNFPEVAMVIDKAIEDGTSVDGVYPLITASIMSTVNNPAKMAAIESPKDIQGGATPVVTVSTKKSAEV